MASKLKRTRAARAAETRRKNGWREPPAKPAALGGGGRNRRVRVTLPPLRFLEEKKETT